MKKLIESLINLLLAGGEELSTDEKIMFWQKVFWLSLILMLVVLYALSNL